MVAKNQEAQKSNWDIILWGFVAILIIVGVVGNYYFRQYAWSLRLAAEIALGCIAILVAGQTVKGRKAWGFIKEARTELRRVVWPTRQETLQMTLIVIAMVIVMALILWGIDSVLLWGVGWLTGQRG